MSYTTKGLPQHKILEFRRGKFNYELRDTALHTGLKRKQSNLVIHRNPVTESNNQDVVVLDDDEYEDNDKYEDLVEEEYIEDIVMSEDEEESDIELRIVYFEATQQKNHKYLPLSKAKLEEVEEIDIEEYCDSDVEEIVCEFPSIVIPSDDEDAVIDNQLNIDKSISKPDATIINKGDTKGGVVRKIMVNPNIKSGIIPMKSILNKDKVKLFDASVLLNSDSRSILKPMTTTGKNGHNARKSITFVRSTSSNDLKNSQSLLKPVITNDNNLKVVNCEGRGSSGGDTSKLAKSLLNSKEPKILIKQGGFNSKKGQSILKPLANNVTDSESSSASKSTPQQTVSQVRQILYCRYCGKLYNNKEELQAHIYTIHPEQDANLSPKKSSEDVRTYTVSEIIELERELRDQSECCKVCSKGLWYLPTLRSHARLHPNGDHACDACRHGTTIIKQLMDHFEDHAGGSDSE